MELIVVLRMVPDVVEELEVAPDGVSLDLDAARLNLSESDDHALEQALLLKERHGGGVTVIALDAPEVDDALYTALAKGATRAIKITGVEPPAGARAAAAVVHQALTATAGLLPAAMILTGTQAIDDLDGLLAPSLAWRLGWPYLGILTAVTLAPDAAAAHVVKEFSGGLRAEYELKLPAVLGIQAAEKPPRYVPVAKVRAAMKSAAIERIAAAAAPELPALNILAMRKPAAAAAAEMLSGAPGEVAVELVNLFAARGLM